MLLGGLIISRNVTIHLHERTRTPAVLIDQAAMQHVLVHVFINAFDSMAGLPEGTSRRLDIVLADIPEQERVRLSIQDSGPGFPEEILATAFEPFVTARNISERNGLGLHFCRTLLSTMDGTISASNGTRGAIICIELPAARLPP